MSLRFTLTSHLPDYLRDAEEVVRAFFPYVELVDLGGEPLSLSASLTDNGMFCYEILSPMFSISGKEEFLGDYLSQKKYSKRLFKNLVYDALKKASGVTLPYGSLTGVRPTKLFYELQDSGEDALCALRTEFRVAEQKAELIKDTVLTQYGIYDQENKEIDLFLNIPFCPTRCAYCSFLSAEYPKIKKFIPSYIASIKKELAEFKVYLKASGRGLRAVYVGGGTPTSLTADELHQILADVPCPQKEFTVEAGRPDTITTAHLEMLKRVGVTRVSVNPQTMTDEVLAKIGRNHTVAETLAAFSTVQSYGFSVNMDFIAGLDGETQQTFVSGMCIAAALQPDNITVHTLSLKRGADLTLLGVKKGEFGNVSEMVNAAREILKTAGYAPYYMYRQKNMADNLENTGYTLNGKASYYNVDIMEETTDIYAVGAGAMSKKVEKSKNLITRLANPKGLQDYLSRIDEIIAKKAKFF